MTFELSAQAFHEAWKHFNLGSKPLTLNVLPSGILESDRRAAQQHAWDELRTHGFGDRDREDDLHSAFLPLHRYESAFDITYRHRTDSGHTRLSGLVAIQRTGATLAVHDEHTVWLRTIRAEAAVRALLDMIPEMRPGPGRGVSVRAHLLDEAAADAGESNRAMCDALVRSGVRRDDARTLVDMAGQPRLAQAQFGSSIMDGLGKRVRAEMVTNCFANTHGWYLLEENRQGAEPWVTVAPIDRPRLETRIQDLRKAIPVD